MHYTAELQFTNTIGQSRLTTMFQCCLVPISIGARDELTFHGRGINISRSRRYFSLLLSFHVGSGTRYGKGAGQRDSQKDFSAGSVQPASFSPNCKNANREPLSADIIRIIESKRRFSRRSRLRFASRASSMLRCNLIIDDKTDKSDFIENKSRTHVHESKTYSDF